MFPRQRSIDSIRPKATPRKVWRFQKREPERVFLYASPQLTLFPTLTKALGVFAAILLGPALALSFSTNATFSKTDNFSKQKLGTGKWIPDIHIEHDHHCLRLSSSLRDAVIYYEFTRDGNPRDDGMVSDGDCIDIPEKTLRGQGKTTEFQAQAFHPENRAWKSRVLEQEIARKKIDAPKDAKDEKKEPEDDTPQGKNRESVSTDEFLPDTPSTLLSRREVRIRATKPSAPIPKRARFPKKAPKNLPRKTSRAALLKIRTIFSWKIRANTRQK